MTAKETQAGAERLRDAVRFDAFMSYSHGADGQLAPRLQAALQRFAKPWWRRRAVRVFRDESSLSVNPHLWSSIAEALDDSRWFILVMSPEAARSEWVNREIEHWTVGDGASRILPVVTAGDFRWADGDVAGSAVPPALHGCFSEEPRWLDLRWASDDSDLDLRDSRFRAVVADLASAIRGIPKDDLESEEVRQHRRTVRTAWGAGALLVTLTVGAVLAGVYALQQRDEARVQATNAEAQARIARDAEGRAVEQAQIAEAARAEAERSARLARSRELAASAINVLDDDPTLSKLLSLAAAEIADPPLESISALHQAQATDPVVAMYRWPAGRASPWQLWADIDPTGERIVAAGIGGAPSRYLEVTTVDDGSVLWSWEHDQPEVAIDRPRFTEDGERVIAGVLWESTGDAGPAPSDDLLGILVWDALSGERIHHVDLGACGGTVQDLAGSRVLARSRPERSDAGCFPLDPHLHPQRLELIDLAGGMRVVLTEHGSDGPGDRSVDGGAAFSGDGEVIAFDDLSTGEVVIADGATGAEIRRLRIEVPGQQEGVVRRLSRDGSLLVYGYAPLAVVDARTGEVVHVIDVRDRNVEVAGDTVLVTTDGGELRRHRIGDGAFLDALPIGAAGAINSSRQGRIVVSDGSSAALVVDPRPRGEVATVATCDGFVWAGSLTASGSVVSFLQNCGSDSVGTTQVVDLSSRMVRYSLPGGWGQEQPISPRGDVFVRQRAEGTTLGSLYLHDLEDGTITRELAGLCRWDWRADEPGESCTGTVPATPFGMWLQQAEWSPDGSRVGAVGSPIAGAPGPWPIAVWDPGTGDLLFARTEGRYGYSDLIFSPDSGRLYVSSWSDDVRVFSADGEQLGGATLGDGSLKIKFVGFDPTGTSIIVIPGLRLPGADSVMWLNAETFEVTRTIERPHDAGVKVAAMSPDRSRFATGSDDGVVRIWSSRTGDLLHEIPVARATIQGLAFVGDDHIAVTPQGGGVLVMTTDDEELISIVGASLVRGLTPSECERFNFGDDCPTLEELRSG